MDIDLAAARLGTTCSLVAALVFYGLYHFTHLEFWAVFAFLGLAGMLFFQYFNRCPSCGRHLIRLRWDIEYCPYCGEYL